MTQSKLEAQLQAARERVAKLEAQLEAEKNKPTVNVGDIVTGEYGRKNKVLVEGPVIAIEGNQALVQGNGLNVHKFFLKDLLVQEQTSAEANPEPAVVQASEPVDPLADPAEAIRSQFRASQDPNDPVKV